MAIGYLPTKTMPVSGISVMAKPNADVAASLCLNTFS